MTDEEFDQDCAFVFNWDLAGASTIIKDADLALRSLTFDLRDGMGSSEYLIGASYTYNDSFDSLVIPLVITIKNEHSFPEEEETVLVPCKVLA